MQGVPRSRRKKPRRGEERKEGGRRGEEKWESEVKAAPSPSCEEKTNLRYIERKNTNLEHNVFVSNYFESKHCRDNLKNTVEIKHCFREILRGKTRPSREHIHLFERVRKKQNCF